MHLVIGEIQFGHMGQGMQPESGDQRGFVAEGGKGDRGVGRRPAGIGELSFGLEFLIAFKMMGNVVDNVGCCQTKEGAFMHDQGALWVKKTSL